MSQLNQIATLLTMLLFITTLTGCATVTHERGNGKVIAIKKVNERDYKPHDATKFGAQVGGSVGAISGAAAGGVTGLGLGALAGASGPQLVAAVFGGGLIGAVIVGSVGMIAGGTLGYAIDVTTPNTAIYQFVVQPDNSSKPITITQYSTPIPVNSTVLMIEKDNAVFIKQ